MSTERETRGKHIWTLPTTTTHGEWLYRPQWEAEIARAKAALAALPAVLRESDEK